MSAERAWEYEMLQRDARAGADLATDDERDAAERDARAAHLEACDEQRRPYARPELPDWMQEQWAVVKAMAAADGQVLVWNVCGHVERWNVGQAPVRPGPCLPCTLRGAAAEGVLL